MKNLGWKNYLSMPVQGISRIQSIGVAGVQNNQGATRVCVQMGICFSKAFHARPELLEMNKSGDFGRLQKAIDGAAKERMFEYQNVRFLKTVRKGEYGKVHSGEHYPCVMDFGRLFEEMEDEWLHCDRKIVLASGLEWSFPKLEEFIARFQKIPDFKRWIFLFPSLSAGEKREYRKQFGILAEKLPVFSNPFEPEKEMVVFIQKNVKGGG